MENEYLSLDQFIHSLELVSNFNIPQLKNTYLAFQFFDLFDKNNRGRISERQLNKCLQKLISSKDHKIKCIK